MASSEHPRDQSASPSILGLETELETSSGGKPAPCAKTLPTAHLTFVIDCARGKPLSLAAPPGPPRAPAPYRGPVTPPVKTYILFCGDSQPHLAQEVRLGGGHLAQVRATRPPCRATAAPSASPVSTLCFQEAPEATGSPLKTEPEPLRSSAWERVVGSLKAFSSCVCGQAD